MTINVAEVFLELIYNPQMDLSHCDYEDLCQLRHRAHDVMNSCEFIPLFQTMVLIAHRLEQEKYRLEQEGWM